MIQDGPSEQWIAQYDETLKQAAADAQATDLALRQVGGAATSPDGEVVVRVNASGATTDLVLRPGVRGLEPEQLARLILRTTQQAQADVGQKVVETMREFLGEGDALEFVKSQVPVVPEPVEEPIGRRDDRADDDYFDNPPDLIK
ncbi:YbaB/EbfC family nucleoid-associated protein [Actinocrispum wychmicini]|uniref:YbaB/EbfC DNA-binding family protein n=1 Tax=Actinocrispum wychmicini TaxID=1213861 RepID=A0A4V2S751_9PSEU|nr:YbaB/EbfC family nucleoid-associated protein [Actinocrispum wychmicini]TCO58200.1 YbaB/EbfC DNA-binding family protein [Actinocrispum wychmicini]